MPFNTSDFTQPPWVAGVLPLTHEECVKVKEKCQKIIDDFIPDRFVEYPVRDYVVPIYNDANQQELINGETYDTLLHYDVEVNTQGIGANGIVPEPTPEDPDPEEQPDQEADPTPNEEVTAEEEV